MTTVEHGELVALRKRVHAELTLGRGIAVCPQTVERLMPLTTCRAVRRGSRVAYGAAGSA
ncbi:hypothetical protein [Candidatus Poriferisodalis sp.]|uniref:hypothetical protein n=1 Tax=Candidatus Poriferisodalis sp. TaxID=3101277 RepID=UPI003AF7A0BB